MSDCNKCYTDADCIQTCSHKPRCRVASGRGGIDRNSNAPRKHCV